MERLTYWCPDGKGGGEWRANVRGTEVKGEEIDRLAAYEDTGLEPEEVEIMRETKSDAQFMLTELCRFCDYDRLEELAKAENEDRLVVLPCKVGDPVWVVFTNGIRPYVVDRINVMSQNQVRVRMRFMVNETLYLTGGNFGKTVFLTREEAEKALKEGQ